MRHCRTAAGKTGLKLAAALLISHTSWSQEPVKVSIDEVRDHLIGKHAMIHSRVTVNGWEQDVNLKVVVDEEGSVISAKAVSGPEQFRVSAEAVEENRKFKPFERDGRPVEATFEDYVSIVPLEQWSDTPKPFPEIRDWNSLRMKLRRTICYGSCPDYSIEVRGNGNVDFQGNQNVLITGHHRGSISKANIRSLFAVFQQANYFSLNERYVTGVTDCPTYTSSIEFDGISKSVVDYVGERAGMPDVVTELEDAIDHLAGSEKWVKGNTETGSALIAEKWEFRSDSEENRELFSNVIARGSPELIRVFVSHGAHALGMTKNGVGPLMNAAERGDLDLVRTLLRDQSDLSADVMSCALGGAAHSGNLTLVQFLIEKGAPMDAAPCGQYQKKTVLMNAVESGKPDVVQEVLRLGPDVNASGGYSGTALAILVSGQRESHEGERIFDLLLAAGADVNSRDEQQRTPLFGACSSGNDWAVRRLTRAGADVNVKDANGQTVLMSCFTDDSVLETIINAGADLTIRSTFGGTAAEEARSIGATRKANLLEAAMKARAAQKQ